MNVRGLSVLVRANTYIKSMSHTVDIKTIRKHMAH